MDNWDATVVYQLATGRHREDIGRGEAAQRLAEATATRRPCAWLAAALAALAARLDPALCLAEQRTPASTTA